MSDPRAPEPGSTGDALYHLAPAHPAPPLGAQGDSLTAPTADAMATHLAELLPKGMAWRSPDGAAFDADSRMGGLMRGLAGGLAALYARIAAILPESTAATLIDSLTDWEAEFGLPDPCLGLDPSRAARLRALLARVRSTGTITPADFIGLADAIGVTISIREPLPFRAGFSRCGAYAERCGGGEPVEFIWIVKPAATEIIPFRAGQARAGTTPLGEIVRDGRLECLFGAIKPAWTKVVFDYSGA